MNYYYFFPLRPLLHAPCWKLQQLTLKQYNHWTLELVQPLKLLFAVEPIQNLYKSVSFFYVILVQNLRGLTSMASTMESTDTNQMFPFQLG
jgi:hypothetical protein